jgi:hypothetical protein
LPFLRIFPGWLPITIYFDWIIPVYSSR